MSESANVFTVSVISGAIPQGLYELRRGIYHVEKKFLTEDALICDEDYQGQHICVYHGDKLIASMFGIDALQSPFSGYTGIDTVQLQNCYYSTRGMIHRDYRGRHNLWAFITYLTFLTGIKLGYVNNVSLFENKAFVELIMDVEWMEKIPPVFIGGVDQQYQVMPAIVNLQYGCAAAWDQLSDELRGLLVKEGFTLPEDSLVGLV